MRSPARYLFSFCRFFAFGGLVGLVFSSTTVFSQKNISITVWQVTTNIPDCDGFFTGDSDPTWWWTGGGVVDDQCYQTTCNGCTRAISESIMNESFDCFLDVPASISVSFGGCEDDGPTGCVLGSALTIACDGTSANRTDNINIQTTNGTYLLGPYCANATGCSGQYCYWARMDVSGNYTYNTPNNNICSYTNMGTLNFNGTLTQNNQNNLCADTEGGEPNVSGGDESVWYRFTTGALVASDVTISFDGSGNGDEVTGYIALYSVNPSASCAFGNLSFVDDASQLVPFVYDVSLTVNCLSPNTTYFVQVDGIDGLNDQGIFNLTIDDSGILVNPADNICNYTDLGTMNLNGNLAINNQNNYCAGVQAGEPNASGGDETVWYRLTTGSTIASEINIRFDGSGNGDDITGSLTIYSVSPSNSCAFANLTYIDDDWQFIPFVYDVTLNAECLNPNTTYFIQVDGVDGLNDEGRFNLQITDNGIPKPLNNNICNATNLGVLSLGGNIFLPNESNFCSDVQPGEPLTSGVLLQSNNTVWYRFTTDNSIANIGYEVYLDASGIPGTFSTILHIFEDPDNNCNTINNLVELQNFDEIGGIADPDISDRTVRCLQPNTTYYMQIDANLILSVLNFSYEDRFTLRIQDNGIVRALNDNKCNATPLGRIPNNGSVVLPNENNYCAGIEPGEYGGVNWGNVGLFNSPEKTIWYTFQAPASRSVEIFLDNDFPPISDDINLEIAVYQSTNNTCTGFFGEIESADPFTSMSILGNNSLKLTCLDPTKTYFIQIDGDNVPLLGELMQGHFQLIIDDYQSPPAPHDSICNAIYMGDPTGSSVVLYYQTNFCADNLMEPIPTGFQTDMTVWYTFTAPASGRVHVFAEDTDNPNGDPDDINLQLAIFGTDNPADPCHGNLFEVRSEYNVGDLAYPFDFDILTNGEYLRDVFCLIPGHTYFIMVDGESELLGTVDELDGYFSIEVEDIGGPPASSNDNICDFYNLGAASNTVGGTISASPFNNECATVEPGEPDPVYTDNDLIPLNGITPDNTLWFAFTAPSTGHVQITANNNVLDPAYPDNVDLQIAVYGSSNGLCTGVLSEIISNYDPLFFSETVEVECLVPGETYFIQVDGNANFLFVDAFGYGWFDVVIQTLAPIPFANNDNLCQSIGMGIIASGGTSNLNNQTNHCATEETGEPNVSGNNNPYSINYDETVWYHFTTSANPGDITINLNSPIAVPPNNFINAAVVLYQSYNGVTCNFNDLYEISSAFNPVWPIPNIGSESLTVSCLHPNTTYYIQVDGLDLWFNEEGPFSISVTDNGVPHIIPNNDNICNFIALGTVPSGSSVGLNNQNNFCASEEPNEPLVSGNSNINDVNYDETVWYSFTTNNNPGTTTVHVDNVNGIDATIAVYSGAPGCGGTIANFSQMIEVDNTFNPNPFNSFIELSIPCLRPNTTYYVQIDGLDLLGDEGIFNISVRDDGIITGFPANDNICNHQHLGTVPSGSSTPIVAADNFCATEEQGEPFVSGSPVITDLDYDETVWFAFTTSGNPGTTTVNITNPSGISPEIHVFSVNTYPSCNFFNLTFIGDNNLGSNQVILNCLNPNTTYYIQVDGNDLLGNVGTFNIQVTDNGIPHTVPVNDNICNATNFGVIPVNGTSTQTNQNNICASEQVGEPNVSGLTDMTDPNYDETVWYRYTTPNAIGDITITVSNTNNLDALISVYSVNPTGSCLFNALSLVRTSSVLNTGGLTMFFSCVPANTQFIIQLDGIDAFGNDKGTFNISVNHNGTQSTPLHDNICGAGNVPIGTTQPGQNFCATVETAEPNAGSNDETVWYTFIGPPSGEVRISIDSHGDIDANFNVYLSMNGSCNFSQLVQVGGNHDNFIPSFPNDPFAFDVAANMDCIAPGQRYYVQIDGADLTGDYGTFDITITNPNPGYVAPPNDNCNGAINLTSYIGSISCQSSQGPPWIDTDIPVNTLYGNPTISIISPFTIGCGANCGDIWFMFTTPIPNSGNILIEGNDEYGLLGVTNSNLTINAYSGSCNNLTPIACDQGGLNSDPFYYIPVNPAGGQTIYLQVYNSDLNSIFNPFGINGDEFGLCITDRCGSDHCLTATTMVVDSVYCWDTQGATGEDLSAGVPGYIECGSGGEPDNSIYFDFMTDSCGGTYNVLLWGDIGGACILGIPTDGLSIALYQDSTPCDNNPQALLDCQQTDICDGEHYVFTHDYGLSPLTPYIIQLDGFDPFFGGGDNRGFITITKVPRPIPNFSATTVCLGQATNFTDLSSGLGHNIIDWIWDFGDGTSATYTVPNNPVHTYNSVDTFDVTLWIRNDPYNQCYDSITLPVIVVRPDTISITPDTSICLGASITLNATGSALYNWFPGGQTTASITVQPTVTTLYVVSGPVTAGCKPSGQVTVTVLQPSTGTLDTSLCSNESITIGTHSYNLAGTYQDTLSNASSNGCDSIIITTISIKPIGTSSRSITICDGDFFYVGGGIQTTAGTYYDTITAVNGCDSVIATNLILLPKSVTNIDTTICQGDSVLAAGSYRDTTGVYSDTLVAANGCDSIVAINLTVLPFAITNINTSICPGVVVIVGTSIYDTSGIYYDTLTSANSCDSIIITNINMLSVSSFTLDTSICPGATVSVGSSIYDAAGTFVDTLISSNSCDSIVTTNISILPIATNTIAIWICQGESIFLQGAYQDSSGTYFDTFAAANSCDSIVTTLLTIRPNSYTNFDTSICEGNTVTVGGSVYDSSGVFIDTLTAVNSCDSIITTTITLLLHSFTTIDTNICPGATVTVGSSVYSVVGNYMDTLPSANSCDSIVATNINILPISARMIDTSICPGNTVIVGSSVYDSAGTYMDTLVGTNGCDSIITTTINALPISTVQIDTNICPGETIIVGGSVYDTAGTFMDTLPGFNSCDSIVTTNIILLPVSYTNIDTSICPGAIIVVGSSIYDAAGTFVDTLASANSCDSIITTTIIMMPVSITVIDTSVCPGMTVTVGNSTYDSNGVYVDTLVAMNGCDSIITTTLNINATYSDTVTISSCDNDSILAGGNYQNTPGLYYDTLSSASGCDSVIVTDLNVNASFLTNITAAICDNDSLLAGGAYQNVSGQYYDTLTSITGCDSVVVTDLAVSSTFVDTLSISICNNDSAFAGGAFQNTTGVYYDTLNSIGGCDSVVVTDLTVNSTLATTVAVFICDNDSFMAGGAYQTSTGLYFDTLASINGCDSIIITDLTVNSTFVDTVSITICDNDSVMAGGTYQNSSGFYFDTLGSVASCDSVIVTELIVHSTFADTLSVTICDNDSAFAGGAYQNSSGLYYDTLNSASGCDSVVITDLTVNATISITVPIVICDNDSVFAGGAYQNISGLYYDTLSSVLGCDSVVITDLTVNITFSTTVPIVICDNDSVFAGGAYQNISGRYYDTLISTLGCDSVIVTDLTVNSTSVTTVPVTICDNDSVLAGGAFQHVSGLYYDTLSSVAVCDSVIVTDLTVLPSSSNTLAISICDGDSIFAGGAYQLTSGTYYDTLISFNICDSVVTTILTIRPKYSVNQSVTICQGQPYHGIVYEIDTLIVDSLQTAFGCDSIINTQLSIDSFYLTTNDESMCDGDSLLAGGNYQTVSGIYSDTLIASSGCDSIVRTNLTVLNHTSFNRNVLICSGDSVLLAGSYQTLPGIYFDTVIAANGCDSIVITDLSVLAPSLSTQSILICQGDSFLAGGIYQYSNGTFLDTLTGYLGCDSIMQTDLTVLDNSFTNLTFNICDGDSIFAGGNFQSSAGIYFDTLLAINGCDSITSTELIVNSITQTNLSVTVCFGQPYGGIIYNADTLLVDTLLSSISCDSIVTVQLSVDSFYLTTVSLSICQGDSVFAGGVFQSSTGTYFDTLTASTGCDSILQTDLNVLNASYADINITICDGDSILADGEYQTVTGVYFDSLIAANGCDSILTTNLFVLSAFTVNQIAEICSGDSILLGGSFQNTSGTYYDSLTNSSGCDSIVQTILSVLPSSSFSIAVSICDGDSILLSGSYQHISGTYYDTLTAFNGCDSVAATALTVHPNKVTNNAATVCFGQPYNGIIYSNDTTLTDTLMTIAGCDSVLITQLTLDSFYLSSINVSICQGDSVLAGGAYQNVPGSYFDTLASTSSCDSILRTDLTVLNHTFTSRAITLCDGDSVFAGGAWQFVAGSYEDTLIATNGCDSILTTNIVVLALPITNLLDTICSGDSLLVGGAYQTTTGVYFDTIMSALGCDSILQTSLTVLQPNTSSVSINICDGDSLFAGGSFQTAAGIYFDTLLTINGCDSIISTTLTVSSVNSNNQSVTICIGQPFNGIVYTSDTVLSDTLASYLGCDSIIITQLSLDSFFLTPSTFSICQGDSLLINGVYQYNAGSYFDTLPSQSGCDSIVQTNLTVLSPFAFSITVSICDGDSVFIGGAAQTTSGIYFDTLTAANGCDSVIATTLAVNPNSSFSQSATVCFGQPYNGLIYTSDTILTDTLASYLGCDSISITQLSIDSFFFTTSTANICQGDSLFAGGSYQTSSGIYLDTFQSLSGCDSIVRIDLFVNPVQTNNIFATVCSGQPYNGTVYLNDTILVNTLSSSLNCDSIVVTQLSVDSFFMINIFRSICEGDSLLAGGDYQTLAGSYFDTLSSISNCDSIVRTNLSILEHGLLLLNPTICDGDTFEFAGTNFTIEGLYFDTLIASNLCDSIIQINLDVVPDTVINIEPIICEGDVFTVGNSTYMVTYLYYDTLTSSTGCDSIVITDLIVVNFEIYVDPSTASIQLGESIQLNVTPNSGTPTYVWTPSQSLNCATCPNPLATPQFITNYMVIAMDQNGCIDTNYIQINVTSDTIFVPNDCPTSIYVPNAFSPNNDGMNDVFYIYGPGIETLRLLIYNRWGEKVFETADKSTGWDGVYNGKLQNPGVYVYFLEVTFCNGTALPESHPDKKGSVTLIR